MEAAVERVVRLLLSQIPQMQGLVQIAAHLESAMTQKMSELSQTITAIEQKVADLGTDHSSLEARVQALEKVNETQRSQITRLHLKM